MGSVDEMIRLFRQRGLRITPQRRAIFALLADDASHPTAEEVYQRVRQSLPDISRMTVYNTLRELVSFGELLEVETDLDRAGRYDPNTSHHHHLLCLRCHALVDVETLPDDLDIPLPDARGYRIVRSQVTYYGYCPACQQAED